jgi:hypothetical protein
MEARCHIPRCRQSRADHCGLALTGKAEHLVSKSVDFVYARAFKEGSYIDDAPLCAAVSFVHTQTFELQQQRFILFEF